LYAVIVAGLVFFAAVLVTVARILFDESPLFRAVPGWLVLLDAMNF
jgi:hypothetical protein